MSGKIGVVDLFAGPGGLGEGFAAAGAEDGGSMRIRLSVEMDKYAVRTLRLRAFLRSFEDGFPPEYYEALNSGDSFPEEAMRRLNPDRWALVEEEIRHLKLANGRVFESLAHTLDVLREEYDGNTVLIGGPPCQAYSVVGRARNRGKTDYVAELDERHFLYTEYVEILERLRPAVFVMENVKGLLSSRIDGGRIFGRVLRDLERAGDGYQLVPLAPRSADLFQSDLLRPTKASEFEASDFLVYAEEHGVPQTRHRVIVVGVRRDLLEGNRPALAALELKKASAPSCWSMIGDLPPLRSRLSSDDSTDGWRDRVRGQAARILSDSAVPEDIRDRITELLSQGLGSHQEHVGSDYLGELEVSDPELRAWIRKPDLTRVIHHETRSHIAEDLGRYLFTAVYGERRDWSPRLRDFSELLKPRHENRDRKMFMDRFRVQLAGKPATTVTSHIAKDGHYFIHPDPMQCRAFTVREAARIQTFPDNYVFAGGRTEQYRQIGNAVPPFLARQIAKAICEVLVNCYRTSGAEVERVRHQARCA
ncbi:Modification methylase [Rubellimicrobium mesophilum DSM 19309]|uniref:DNA (cytosine-5-)-methyltransferase n=1 Tax=Rubellimicrobium mesophilum DSM 19309 TaxID=442562 RepID=A0A017HJ48_9RHOB|nr:DNA cytosine methyltransferase [Rubellimicrobium mesophilum]EYD74381.1 Modification methylase [Rubellimicrobium mesophilum DSM 19309]